MKLFLQLLALPALLRLANAQNKPNGANCDTNVEITCVVRESDGIGSRVTGKSCLDLIDYPCEENGNVVLEYTFVYCNNNGINVDLKEGMTNPHIDNIEILDVFNKGNMGPGECRTVRQKRSYSTCFRGQAAAGMTLNGWMMKTNPTNADYCYSYDFIRFSLRSGIPIENPLPASVDLDIQTHFKDDVQGSDSLPWIPTDELGVPGSCAKLLRTTYTITNDGDSAILVSQLVGEKNKLLLSGDNIGRRLTRGESLQIREFDKLNVCERNGEEVPVHATVVASDETGSARAAAIDAAKANFLIPFINPKIGPKSPGPALECKYRNQACSDYTIANGCWEGDADFTYHIQKVDLGCHIVDTSLVRFNGAQANPVAHLSEDVCTKSFCHDDVLTLVETRFVNICELSPPGTATEVPVNIKVEFDIGFDDVDLIWIPDPNILFPFPPTPPPIPLAAAPVPAPAPIPASGPPANYGTICEKRSDSLWFRFTGKDCSDSYNGQRMLKKNKNQFMCDDYASMGGSVEMSVNDVIFQNVGVGSIIEITGGPTNTEVHIDGVNGRAQEIYFHSSCSGSLKLGDRFGSLELVGFDNSKQGKIMLEGF